MRAIEATAHAVGLRAYLVAFLIERIDAATREQIALRTGHYANFLREVLEMVERVVAVVVGAEIVVGVRRGVVKAHHVAEREAPPLEAAQAALQVGGSAAHDAGHIHAAVGDGQISVYAALGGRH